MKILFQNPVKSVRGKFSTNPGIVGSWWRGIPTARGWVQPTNPKSADQVLIRNMMTQAAQGFQDISEAERLAWAVWAAAHKRDWIGLSYQMTEINAYALINTLRLIDGQALIDAAPSVDADYVATNIATVAYNSGTTVLSFIVTHTAAVVTGRLWMIKITGPLPSFMKRVRENDFRLCLGCTAGSIIPVTATPQTVQITAPKFGNWTDGDPMAIKLIPLSAEYVPGLAYEEINAVTVT